MATPSTTRRESEPARKPASKKPVPKKVAKVLTAKEPVVDTKAVSAKVPAPRKGQTAAAVETPAQVPVVAVAEVTPVAQAEPVTVPRKVTLVAGKVWNIPTNIPKDKVGWSDARRRYTIAYLGRLQMLMRLADWEITLDFDTPSEEDCLATIDPVEYQRRARMDFGTHFMTISPAEQRQTLIHEFLHLHLIHLEQIARDAVKALGGDDANDAFGASICGEVERTTDGLADLIAPFLEPFELPSR